MFRGLKFLNYPVYLRAEEVVPARRLVSARWTDLLHAGDYERVKAFRVGIEAGHEEVPQEADVGIRAKGEEFHASNLSRFRFEILPPRPATSPGVVLRP